jgi:hypothetical protein
VSVGPYINRGSAYEKKGELDKALSDFRAAGSTAASEDINRVERAIVKALNDRGLSYAKKDEYDRAIADILRQFGWIEGPLSHTVIGALPTRKKAS